MDVSRSFAQYRVRAILLSSFYLLFLGLLMYLGSKHLSLSELKDTASPPLRQNGQKVIMLGFDGADPDLCERWINELNPQTGQPWLANLAKLKSAGEYSMLQTTNPAQTPVAWSTLATSANPGVTSIADFVGRDPETMSVGLTLTSMREAPYGLPSKQRVLCATAIGLLSIPLVCMILGKLLRWRFRKLLGVTCGLCALGITLSVGHALLNWIPTSLPHPVNQRDGIPFWKITGEAGIRTRMLRFPLTFPAEIAPHLTMLAGFGVPDATRTQYSWNLFDAAIEQRLRTETFGTIWPFERIGEQYRGSFDGPENPLLPAKDANKITQVRFDYEASNRVLQIGRHRQVLQPNVWSEPFQLQVSFSPLVKLNLTTRAVLLKADPPCLLIGPLQFDPHRLPPQLPLSYPHNYAKELAAAVGTYATMGWDIATHPAKDGVLPDQAFLNDLAYACSRDRALFAQELARDDWDLLVGIFMFTDRASHILWKHLSEEHPLHNPETATQGVEALREVYIEMDRIVGEALERARAVNAEVMIVSDHGFAPFNYQVNLNTVLRNEKLLELREESLEASARHALTGENFARIDFSRTQAYALGLGGIYLNLKDRELHGIVTESERELVTKLVENAMYRIVDANGRRVVRRVVRSEYLFRGPHAWKLPDLIVCFQPGYRVSWSTVVGGVPEKTVEPNFSNWSGDHCSIDPDFVPGIFFSTRPLELSDRIHAPSVLDIAPTLLGMLELEVPANVNWEGRNLYKKTMGR